MNPNLASDLVASTATATVLAGVAVLSIAAALRWHTGRRPALLLAWAMLQHAVDQLAGSGSVWVALGVASPAVAWIARTTAYFIAVPWALLVEEMIGPGWKMTVRRTWQAFLAFAIAATVYDAATGRPGAAQDASRLVVAAGALVGFLNLSRGAMPAHSDLRVLRIGILIFMALVMHDVLARAGFLPWRRGSGPLGVLICVGAIAYTVISRTLRTQRELQAIEHELATARRIQASLLPASAPLLDGATIGFRYVPAAAVAGDLFDFLDPHPRRTGILVADVSGHGVPAALIASMVKVAAAAQKPHADDPARVLSGIHLALAGDLPRAHFVTAIYAYVDLDRGLIRYASAGHPPALVWRAADRRAVAPGDSGPMIVSFVPPQYPIGESVLAEGDRVVLYTDGVVEAMRGDDEMFGVERLRELVATAGGGPEALLTSVVEALSRFTGRSNASFEDDCTLVALEIGAPRQRAMSAPD